MRRIMIWLVNWFTFNDKAEVLYLQFCAMYTMYRCCTLYTHVLHWIITLYLVPLYVKKLYS